ncbi:MAG: zinc ABC transporter substrate-binding protein [Planctomycetota bacterium]
MTHLRHFMFLSLVCLAALALASGCGAQHEASGNEGDDSATPQVPYTIVCTIGMVSDIVREVAGSRAEVEGLLAAGIDPHLYKPTRSDMAKLMDADVIFYNGLLLEGRMTDVLVGAATSGKAVHPATELIDESFLIQPEDVEGYADPHVWMDPQAWSKAVEAVRDALVAYDPDGAAMYEANASTYLGKLEQLAAYTVRALESVPESQRVLVTAHDAFNYFGKRYGYEVVGIQGMSTESEAGVRDIEFLVDLLVEREIGAVFVESTVSERNVRALIEGARARGHEVVVGGELFSDAMGDEGTYEGTYVGMIDHNATTIARALGGEAPEGGYQGLLSQEDGE